MSDGTATPKSKLDTLSKEDLIKFVKKQVINLKVAKDQCAEQQQKIAALEEEAKRLKADSLLGSHPHPQTSDATVQIDDGGIPVAPRNTKTDTDSWTQTENDAEPHIIDNADKIQFANNAAEHQLRQQILVLRTALNRRRLEIEDLHASLNERAIIEPTKPPTSDASVSTDLNAIATVEVQTQLIELVNVGVQCEQSSSENCKTEEDDSRLLLLSEEINTYKRTVEELGNELALKCNEVSFQSEETKRLNDRLNVLQDSLLAAEDNLEKAKSSLHDIESENNNIKSTLQEKETQLESLQMSHRALEMQLNDSKKTEKDNDTSLLALELEDYQRTVEKLQGEATFKNSELAFKTKENQSLNDELKRLRESLFGVDENLAKTKGSLNDLESENNDLKFRLREKEVQLDSTQVNCRALELQLNDAKLELAGIYSKHQQNVDSSEELITSLKRQLASKEQECERLKRESSEMSSEFEVYKVRVHSALRQKRTGSEDTTPFQDQKLAFETTISSLQEQLFKTNSLYQSTLEELRRSIEQSDQATAKHKDREARFEQTIETLRKQISELRYELTIQKQTHDEFIQSSSAKQNQLKYDFEERVRALTEQNEEKESEMRLQISRLEDSLREARATKFRDSTFGFVEFEERPSPPLDERKPAEGSENVDFKPTQSLSDIDRPISPPFLPDSTHLDNLLNFDERSDTDVRSTAEYALLETKVEDTARRNRHLVEVLAESEANSTRLNEQIRLLKEEIRRLERNQEREKHVANAEYLKNVIMKFVNPKAKEQRASLVPVLATLLRLSADEIKLLQELCDESGHQNSASAGWSGYLHRWSGLT